MRKRVLILGQEGYIGTALTRFLSDEHTPLVGVSQASKYDVFGVDNNSRDKNVKSVGSESLTRKIVIGARDLNVATDVHGLRNTMRDFKPDAIVHLAEQPSAPFSMTSAKSAMETQRNNVCGTLNVLYAMKQECPTAHLIKLGTEGEYPDWLWDGKHIPEGSRMSVYTEEAPQTSSCIRIGEGTRPDATRSWEIPTPRYAGSWYHWSKVFDSMNIDYACRIWGLSATDVNQGVVYGHVPGTRLDYDQYFGTVVHRFVVQAVAGIPLTVYGEGEQTRGFIALRDSIKALQLLIDNPPAGGEFRVIHQTTEAKTINEIAELVQKVTGCKIEHVENPRAERSACKFTFDNSTLLNLGLLPTNMEEEIRNLVPVVEANKERINKDVIKPTVLWK